MTFRKSSVVRADSSKAFPGRVLCPAGKPGHLRAELLFVRQFLPELFFVQLDLLFQPVGLLQK
jgi:hypothetical protein